MKPFEQATNLIPPASGSATKAHAAAESCAALLLETAPIIMGTVRRLISASDATTLTVQQFRTLNYLQRHGKASLSETAAFLNLALPSTSKLVDQLVRRGLLSRHHDTVDRRRMVLAMTPTGQTRLSEAQAEMRRRLAETLGFLESDQLAAFNLALVRMRQSLSATPSERVRKPQPVAEAAK